MKISLKILALISALVLLISSLGVSAFAKSKEDLEQELEDSDQRIEELEDKLATLEKDKNKQEDYITTLNKQIKEIDAKVAIINGQLDELNAQIADLDSQIAVYAEKITSLENEINDVDKQIAEKNAEISETYALLEKRLRASYMAGETSELEIFLNATSFQDFLTRSELVRQIAKHDKALVKDLEDKIKSLNEMVKELNEKRAELETSKKALDDDRAKIDSKRQEQAAKKRSLDIEMQRAQKKLNSSNNMIGELNEKSALYQKLKREAEIKNAQLADELDKWTANNGSSGSGEIVAPPDSNVNHHFRISSKGMICPLQDGAVAYSANYSSHVSRGTAAVDFTAPANRLVNGKTYYTTKGAKLYAVASGKVIKSTYSASGYGHHLIIDHGNGVSTLYAHCDARYVNVGDTVKQGQVIALAGNTGNCWPRPSASNPVAGSHLHFEVRINGNRVNPEPYMPYPFI